MRSVKVQYVGRQKTNSFDSLLSGGIGASSQRIFLRFGLWYSNWLVFFGPKGLKLMMLWWYGVKVRRQLPVQFGYYRSSAISADRDLNSDGNVIISVCRSSQRYCTHAAQILIAKAMHLRLRTSPERNVLFWIDYN